MERPVRAKFNTQIYEEASEWFVECRAGDLDDVARAEFNRWLRKSPEHQSAYLEIAAIWNEGPTLDSANRWNLDALIAQAAEDSGNIVALERTAQPIPTVRSSHEGRRSGPQQAAGGQSERHASKSAPATTTPAHADTRRRLFAIAASILLVTATLVTYLLAPRGVYATTLGEQRSLALNDGSTVQLNSLSKIRIRYTQHERTVDLVEGQALFHVAKDSTRPFVVHSGKTLVRAVGTQFDVYRKADGTIVTVVEGRVAVLPASSLPSRERGRKGDSKFAVGDMHTDPQRQGETSTASASHTPEGHTSMRMREGEQEQPNSVSAPTDERPNTGSGTAVSEDAIFVAAGEQVTVTPQAARKTVHPNVTGATAWTERRLVFDSASLTDVADEFNRYNERKLVIDPSALGGFHISGVFSSTDPASLIRFLRDRPGLRVIETPSEIRVEKDL